MSTTSTTASAPGASTDSPVDTSSAVHVRPPAGGKGSALGGADKIKEGLNSFLEKHGAAPVGGAAKPAKTEAATPEVKIETGEKKGVIPPVKTVQSTETPPADDKRGTDGRTAEERAAFLNQKTKSENELAELRQKAKDRDTAHAELQKTKERIAELEKQHEMYEKEMAPVRLVATKKFKETIEEPLKALTNGMHSLCKRGNLEFDKVANALDNPDLAASDAALTEFASNLPDLTKSEFYQVIRDYRTLMATQARMMADAPAALAAAQEADKRAAAEAKEREAETRKVVDGAVWEAMVERFPSMLKDDEEMAASVRAAIDDPDYDVSQPDFLAYAKQAGALLQFIPDVLKKKDDKIAELEKSLSKYTRQTSPANGSQKAPDASAATEQSGGQFKASKRLSELGFNPFGTR